MILVGQIKFITLQLTKHAFKKFHSYGYNFQYLNWNFYSLIINVIFSKNQYLQTDLKFLLFESDMTLIGLNIFALLKFTHA